MGFHSPILFFRFTIRNRLSGLALSIPIQQSLSRYFRLRLKPDKLLNCLLSGECKIIYVIS